LISLCVIGVPHIIRKFLTRTTTLFNLTSIGGLHTKLYTSKIMGIPILGNLGLPFGSPRTKCHLDAGPMATHIIYYIKVTLFVCLSVRAVSRHCPDLCFFVFFLDGFYFLCQLNYPDFFYFYFLWVLFSVSVKLPRPLFFLFFFMGFVFCVS